MSIVQDEDKKSAADDGHTTEDESSQDSKGKFLIFSTSINMWG